MIFFTLSVEYPCKAPCCEVMYVMIIYFKDTKMKKSPGLNNDDSHCKD